MNRSASRRLLSSSRSTASTASRNARASRGVFAEPRTVALDGSSPLSSVSSFSSGALPRGASSSAPSKRARKSRGEARRVASPTPSPERFSRRTEDSRSASNARLDAMEEWLPSFARREHTANGLREGTGPPVASKKRLSSSSSSVADDRRSTPSSATFVSVSRWTTFTRDHGTRFAHVFSSDSSSGVAVETTTCELRVAFASCVPSSVSRASRASHAASDAADAASVAALACAFHPAVSTPRVCSTASVRHLSARAAFASAEYRPPKSRSAALGASGDRTCPCQRGACRKTRKLPRFRTRRSAGASRRTRRSTSCADGTAGSSCTARREARAGSRARRIVAASGSGDDALQQLAFGKQAFFFICHMAKFTLPARRVTRSNHRRVWSSGFRRSSEARRLNSLSCFADFSSPYPWTTGLSAPGRRERARRARYEDDGRLHPL